ncbi:MAG: outer membrane beta-barrel protein, partial [Gammaproteobacteria bacterium]|nr:outer membrane beta-barrel protein [Gammaproteobacteria bacterium]
ASNEENETLTYLGAGFDSDLKLSRQHLLLNGLVERTKYDDFGELDNTRLDGRATWDWEVGNLWSGSLGSRYLKEMSSFTQVSTRNKEMRTRKTNFLEVGYQLHPDLRLSAEVDVSDVSYENRKRLDRDVTGAQFDVLYKNTLNTKVGLRVRRVQNDLNRGIVGGVPVSNDYAETTVSGLLFWEATGISSLEARFGYTDLTYDDLDDRDFQGVSGRLTYISKLTGKTQVNVAVWHETSTFRTEISSYVLSKGISISPRWSVTSKVYLDGDVSFVNDDFKGTNKINQSLGLPKRDDDTLLYRVSANWEPRGFVRVTLSYRNEDRNSSDDIRDYDDEQVDFKVQLTY